MKSAIKSRRPKIKNYNLYSFMNLSLVDMEGEEWEDIPQFDGYYMVSNYGRIWALPRPVHSITGQMYNTRERIRKQYLDNYYNQYTNEYTAQLTVHLRYEQNNFSFKVSRLVYEFFVGPLDANLLVVHKDGDNCNNRYDNLVLMNHTELYGHRLSLKRIPRTGHIMRKSIGSSSEKNRPRPIVKYSLDGKVLSEYESMGLAALANNVHRSSIRSVVQQKLVQLHGFVYRIKDTPYDGEHAGFSYEKRVTQYALDGKKVMTYPSVKEAALYIGTDPNTLSKCALRKSLSCQSFVWRYDGDSYNGEYKDKVGSKPLEIIQYSLGGKKLARFTSFNEASRLTGFTAATLRDCAYKRSKVAHGFVWRFPDDPYNGEHKLYHIGKPVTQYTLDGKKINSFPTIEAAARATGLTPDNIQKNVKGANKTAGGFVWKPATAEQARKVSLATSQYTHNPDRADSKKVIQFTIEGKKQNIFASITEAAKASGISVTSISTALNKPGRTAAGFVWRTKGNPYGGEIARMPSANKSRIVTQYDLNGTKLHIYKSTRQAETITGVNSSSISSVARGKLKTTGGFIWQYGDGPQQIDISEHFASTVAHRDSISKSVLKYSLAGEFLKEYPSISAAAREEGISAKRISAVVNGQSISAGGDLWRLKE